MCLQRRRHLRFAPWCIVSGYVRACSNPRIIRDTCRLSPPSWHRFPSGRNVSVEALKIGSNVLDEAFSVRGRFPLLLSATLPLSHAHSGLEHFRCIYARMHRPIHRHSDRSRSLYRINYNVHGSRTRIAIRSIRVPEGVLFNYIYTARGNSNGREINVRGIPGTTGSGCSRASIRGSRF